MELNREQQIVRAYECCHSILLGCGDCPFIKNDEECADVNMNIVAVLKSQEEKIKQLTQAHEMLSESYDALEKTKDELLSERSRLTEENAELKRLRLCELVKANNLACDNALLQTVTAQRERTTVIPKSKIDDIYTSGMMDGVRQMQSKIKERCIKGGIYPAFVASTIDQIAKELIGDE